MRERSRLAQRRYDAKPEVKARKREYNARPETKARVLAYARSERGQERRREAELRYELKKAWEEFGR